MKRIEQVYKMAQEIRNQWDNDGIFDYEKTVKWKRLHTNTAYPFILTKIISPNMLRTKEFNYNQNPTPEVTRAEEENIMNYKITIREIHKAVVDIEANSYDEALRRVKEEYQNNPNDYVLETKDRYIF